MMKKYIIYIGVLLVIILSSSCESYIDLPYYVLNKSEDSIFIYANGKKSQSQDEAGPVAPDSVWRDYINEKDLGMLRVHIVRQRTVDSLTWSNVLQNGAFDKTFVFDEEELLEKKRLIIYMEE